MSIICDPSCVGSVEKCCLISDFPMNLVPLKPTLHNAWLVISGFFSYFWPDVLIGACVFLVFLSFVSLTIKAYDLGKRNRQKK